MSVHPDAQYRANLELHYILWMVDEHRKLIPFATTGKARHSNEAESFFNRRDIGDKWSSAGKTTVLWAQPKWIISLVCQPFPCRPPYFSPPMQKDRVSGTSSVKVTQIIDYKLCEPEIPVWFPTSFPADSRLFHYFICVYDISTIARVTLPHTFSSYQAIAPAPTSLAEIPNRICTKSKDKWWWNVNNESFF